MADVQKSFEALQQDISLRYHDKVLLKVRESTVSLVRKSLPDDLDLLRSEITALIHLEKYQEAMDFLPPKPEFDFERAYVLYKLNRFAETARLCEFHQEPKFLHLLAQAVRSMQYYKLGNFPKAQAMYQDLAAGDNTPALVNLAAAGVAPGLCDSTVRHAQLNAAGEWEILYNKSLAFGMEGRTAEAMQTLDQAQKVLSKEEDVEDENWQIELQRGYLLQRMEESQQAKSIYTNVLASQLKDPNSRAVATHNLAVLSETATVLFDLQKTESKLTVIQEAALMLNLALIYSKKRKTQEYEECLGKVEAMNMGDKGLVIRAWNLMREKKQAEYEALLRGRGTSYSLRLLSAIFVQQKKSAEAAAVYRDVIALTEKRQQTPEQYLTLAGLFDRSNNLPEAIATLESCISQFPNHKPTIRRLWECLHRNSQFSEAAHYLETYQKQFSGDLDTTSLLVLAEANVDLQAALKYAAALPEVNLKALYSREGVIESLDQILDRLEATGAATRAKPEEAKVDPTAFQRKKRKRKPKYPKGFDPTNPSNPPPDPERWLAKKDRSTYKKTKKQKKEQKMKGPQGEMPSVAGQEQGSFATGPSTKHIEAVVDKNAPKKKSKKKK